MAFRGNQFLHKFSFLEFVAAFRPNPGRIHGQDSHAKITSMELNPSNPLEEKTYAFINPSNPLGTNKHMQQTKKIPKNNISLSWAGEPKAVFFRES